MRVEQHVMEILERSKIEGALLRLPPEKLDRPVYEAVNKVIVAAGGKWHRGQKAHVFDGEAMDTIEPILLTGEYTRTKQDFGQFDTPPDVVERVIRLARIKPGMMLLEPSCGLGNIVVGAEAAGAAVTGYEIDAKRLHAAKDRCTFSGGVHLRDFLLVKPERVFDVVAMNPPFAKQADIIHMMHATKFLKPGGKLVSVMSASITFRSNARTVEFRSFMDQHDSEIEKLEADAFRESGTGVNAVLVSFEV